MFLKSPPTLNFPHATAVTSGISYPRDDTLIFMIASPVTLEVIGPDGRPHSPDSQGFIIIPNPLSGSYQAKLQGTGEGEYHLLVGQLFDQDFWSLYRGGVETGDEIIYEFNIEPGSPKENPLAGDEKGLLNAVFQEAKGMKISCLNESLKKVEEVIREMIEGEIDPEEIEKVIDHLFVSRKDCSDLAFLKKSEESIKLLTETLASLLEEEDRPGSWRARKDFLSAWKQRLRSRRTIRFQKKLPQKWGELNEFSLISYKAGEDYLDQAKQFLKDKNYPFSFAYSYTAFYFFKEIF